MKVLRISCWEQVRESFGRRMTVSMNCHRFKLEKVASLTARNCLCWCTSQLRTKKHSSVEMLCWSFCIGMGSFSLFRRILHSAQVHRASLRPVYPGCLTPCTCGCVLQRDLIARNACHLEYCPMHDIYDEEKECTGWAAESCIVLYPPLEEGDRVIRGPDWTWGNQDGNGEGTVIRRKEWKGCKDMGVGVMSWLHCRSAFTGTMEMTMCIAMAMTIAMTW